MFFEAFDELNKVKGPKLLHGKTIKGKGYDQAVKDQVKWHSPGLFDKKTGVISDVSNGEISFQEVFGESMVELMKTNEDIVAIPQAMLSGSQLIRAKENLRNRVLDVGMAEQ